MGDMKQQRALPERVWRELARVPRNVRRLLSRAAPRVTGKMKTGTPSIDRYEDWISKNEPNREELDVQRRHSAASLAGPKISLLIPVSETSPRFLDELFESIVAQTYGNWEACVVDAASSNTELLRQWSEADPRIHLDRLVTNLGIAENTNRALHAAEGDFIALVDHDDVLAPFALHEVACAIRQNPGAEIFYSDEDRLSESGKRTNPFFKPEWSPELLYSCMYFGHLTAYDRHLAVALGGFRKEFDLSQDYDFALRAVERSQKIVHIPHVLYHWREHAASGASGGKPEARKTNIAALADAVKRRGLQAEVLETPTANRVRMVMTDPPRVSVIIPTDSPERAIKCGHDLVAGTGYPYAEFILVANTSLIHKMKESVEISSNNVRLIPFDEPFNFSSKCNAGAREAIGERLIFLNDDVEPKESSWVQNVIEPLENPEVGAVAPKLLYEDGRIQHAGLVTGVREFVGTAFHREQAATRMHVNFAQSMRNVAALSGACLAVRRDTFFEVGGFDEKNAAIAHSDIDLCFRIRLAGMRCVYTPFTELQHTGRASAGLTPNEAKPRRDKSTIYLLNRWGEYVTRDPFFTDNMRDWLFADSPVPIQMFARNQFPPTPSQIDILFVSPDLTRSGAPLSLFHLAEWCRGNGFFVTVAAPVDGPLRNKFVAAEIPLIIDPLTGKDHPSFGRLIGNFDVVVANTVKTADAITVRSRENVPRVWWLHETELGQRFLRKDARISAALSVADLLVAPSDRTLAIYREHTAGAVHKLIYGIPDFAITIKSKPRDTDRVLFLMIGTIEKRKGQDILIEAIRRMNSTLAAKAFFQIVGSGTETEFIAQFREAANSFSNVRVDEAVDYEESLRLIASVDVLVCASRDESMPLTILEAMCFGKTIVSTAVGGIPEYLTDGVDGLVVSPDNPVALAAALERVIRDREGAAKLGTNARALFEMRHTIGDLGRDFADLLEPLVSARKQDSDSLIASENSIPA